MDFWVAVNFVERATTRDKTVSGSNPLRNSGVTESTVPVFPFKKAPSLEVYWGPECDVIRFHWISWFGHVVPYTYDPRPTIMLVLPCASAVAWIIVPLGLQSRLTRSNKTIVDRSSVPMSRPPQVPSIEQFSTCNYTGQYTPSLIYLIPILGESPSCLAYIPLRHPPVRLLIIQSVM